MKRMCKKIIAGVLCLCVVSAQLYYTDISETGASVTLSGGSNDWSLVWSDEFDQTIGGSPDTSVWSYDTGDGGWGNNERQYYTNSTDSVYIADVSSDSGSDDGSALAIKAYKFGNTYYSGRIKTINNVYVKYGRIEAKIKVENGSQSGIWPAFWMMGNNYSSVGWPWCGELDIMEHRNTETTVIGTLHWNSGTGTSTSYSHEYAGSETTGNYGSIDSIESWHTYAVEWYEDYISFYVDDVCYQTMSLSSEMEEFQEEFFIILNLAIGSTSTAFTLYQTVSSSFTSATMYVDYVRVYQGSDSSFSITTPDSSEGETTTVKETTSPSGLTSCVQDSWTDIGFWNYYVGTSWSGATASYSGGSTQDEDLTFYINSGSSGDWGIQLMTDVISVTAGKTYYYSITVNSNSAGDSVLLKDYLSNVEYATKTLVDGDTVYSGSFTATLDTVQFLFNLTNVSAGTTLVISDFSLLAEDETTSATTAAPTTTTTVAATTTTTAAPTTTTTAAASTTSASVQTTAASETTTVSETVQQTTVQAAETSGDTLDETAASGSEGDSEEGSAGTLVETTASASTDSADISTKTKIKKAKYKKAINKIKISLKKVSGAVKYKVKVSSKKKFKKKNIILRKTIKSKKKVSSGKFKIKSKKFKNLKKVYIKARAIAVVSGKKYKGKWSKRKKVKIKK